jgi:predicted nucleotidyltransferase
MRLTTLPTDRIAQIRAGLATIERDHGVTVLFAVESGSRAWGFESTDSDWDIRLIHLHPPRHYLRVFPARDVIENSDVRHADPDLDFSGWDVRKFLQLATKSNPAVFEWLQSPLIYCERDVFATLRPLLAPFFSPLAAAHHYLSSARHNYRAHMRDGQTGSVRLKKYLYITRPLLCLRWIEANPLAGPPPMAFSQLLYDAYFKDKATYAPAPHSEMALFDALTDLKRRKMAGEELDEGTPIPVVNAFIDAELARWQVPGAMAALPVGKGDVRVLDNWLHQTVLSGRW